MGEKAENVAIAKLAGAKSAHAKAEGVMLKAKLNKEKVAKDGDDRLNALKKKHNVAEKKLDSKLHAVFEALRKKVKKADAAQDVLVKAAKGIWKAENAVYAKATWAVAAALKQHDITGKEQARTKEISRKAVNTWNEDHKALMKSRTTLEETDKFLHAHVATSMGY